MRKRHAGYLRRLARRLHAIAARREGRGMFKARQERPYNPEAEARRRDADLFSDGRS